ncbi:PEP/pyruvate-binding domain-containing protein [Rhodococcus koreensis]|uniref:PEP/pyruvate-binding domain-containing protein n=1 Tax=Rhodococcus koreensis TaxID=99653 RepID=UPI0036725A44
MTPITLSLDNAELSTRAAVGGKAMSLARMTQAGIAVPPAFAVTTAAYRLFVQDNRLVPVFEEALTGLDFADPEAVEQASRRVRDRILTAALPQAVSEELEQRYAELVKDQSSYVAVRSSSTAEDMGDASFAGLYDSFLDVRGIDEVAEAVRKCWASLWTARCTSYRNRLGIDHCEAEVGIVVQRMVEATTAGVLFTANPLNGRTDEMVVNANWGLGDSIASGVATPDEYILESSTLNVKRRTLGGKALKVVRAESGVGISEVSSSDAERSSWTLDDAELRSLATIARRAVGLAGGLPQDIEWAACDGEFFILQSRDITGAEFVWNEDIETWQSGPDDDETMWSNVWAQQYWNGAVTPLFYSVRARELRNSDEYLFRLWGFDDLGAVRRFKFFRSTVYFNSDADQKFYQYFLPVRLRDGSLSNLPPSRRADAATAPFDLSKYVRTATRIRLLTGEHGPIRGIGAVYKFIEEKNGGEHWPTAEEVRGYTDAEVRRELASKSRLFEDYMNLVRPTFHVYAVTAFACLRELLANWYDGDNQYAFEDLISGLPDTTAMLQEQLDLWGLAEQIRSSPALRNALEAHEGKDFFIQVARVAGGQHFLSAYQEFLAEHGHRGHQDRDFWFPRRCEDPSLDYHSLKVMVEAEKPPFHSGKEHKRLETTREVEDRLRSLPFGSIRVDLFRLLLGYIHRFLVLRDDERPFADRCAWGKKVAAVELGRRLYDRGLIDAPDDFYFLAEYEIYDVLEGRDKCPLTKAKIAARRSDFERALANEVEHPDYLRAYAPVWESGGAVSGDENAHHGIATSRGEVTGKACIVNDLRDIGKLTKGDILVCNSTDPGWTPVFGKISGLVLEAGGMLSHGACLSREYGLPAVTVGGAMKKIPNGAIITVDGDNGKVFVHAAE